ncbi:hypothetical protein FEM48_ZijujUnG0059700 [Ziziphus jujuba var. spinosa]|uniref:Uncharacterized protein n=1 Tax=Ziziphus jujuba var. spinosa TaxID=714518 RepID=A0A978U908_ZIZJJ|nr:hypothetical protein FEM48_ZijujUnG0059700 [Ziziphus jujuba var. spinosa]
MGLTLYLGMKRGNIACHKSEARFGTLLREGRLASRASRDEAFWRSQVNFGPPNPATDEKALWSKGKRVRCHTPCLPKVPKGRARRSRATTREGNPIGNLCSRKLYRQQQTRFDPGLPFHYFFHDEGTASASVEVVERPPESKRELLHLSPRDTIRYLNRLKESEEAATLPAHGEASSFWSTSSALNAPQSESKRMGQGDETRVDLRQSGASGGMAACAVPSSRIPDLFRH